MKKIVEDLNPKCKKISQDSYDYLFKVSGQAESLSWDMHLLAEYLDKDYAIGFEGLVQIKSMAARIRAISDEFVDLINTISEKDMEP